jgi:hypothetical protein
MHTRQGLITILRAQDGTPVWNDRYDYMSDDELRAEVDARDRRASADIMAALQESWRTPQ